MFEPNANCFKWQIIRRFQYISRKGRQAAEFESSTSPRHGPSDTCQWESNEKRECSHCGCNQKSVRTVVRVLTAVLHRTLTWDIVDSLRRRYLVSAYRTRFAVPYLSASVLRHFLVASRVKSSQPRKTSRKKDQLNTSTARLITCDRNLSSQSDHGGRRWMKTLWRASGKNMKN